MSIAIKIIVVLTVILFIMPNAIAIEEDMVEMNRNTANVQLIVVNNNYAQNSNAYDYNEEYIQEEARYEELLVAYEAQNRNENRITGMAISSVNFFSIIDKENENIMENRLKKLIVILLMSFVGLLSYLGFINIQKYYR